VREWVREIATEPAQLLLNCNLNSREFERLFYFVLIFFLLRFPINWRLQLATWNLQLSRLINRCRIIYEHLCQHLFPLSLSLSLSLALLTYFMHGYFLWPAHMTYAWYGMTLPSQVANRINVRANCETALANGNKTQKKINIDFKLWMLLSILVYESNK